MKIIRKRPGAAAEVIRVENTLEALQQEVQGYIEAVTLDKDSVLLCNEEGFLMGLENQQFLGTTFAGAVLIVGTAGEEFADVPEKMIRLLCGGAA